ncbi:hypothetical protein D3C84_494560 [compost metagenome]
MTREEYFQWTGAERAEIEAAAASRNMTGQELVELLMGCSVQKLEEIGRQPGAPRNVVAQVSGNVIQVNFSARAAASWNGRKTYKAPSKRLHSASRVSLMPIRVPSTAPSATSATVPSTSPDTVVPYSSR